MMHLLLELVRWLHTHPEWAAVITFLVTFTESIAIVGLFIPGSVVLSMIGGLVGAGILPPASIFIGAILGAIAGDGLSYFLGYRYKDKIRRVWPFRKFPAMLEKGEAFFAKRGGMSVFLGRFLGPLRPTIPIISGMMNLKPYRFIVANVSSALIWAPGYMVPGIIIGAGLGHIFPHHAGKIITQITVILLLLWLFYWLIRKQILNFASYLNMHLHKVWHNMHETLLLKNLLRDAQCPRSNRQIWLSFGALCSGIGFLILFTVVALHINLNLINMPVHKDLLALHNPYSDHLILIITLLGEKMILLPLGLLTFCYLGWQKHWRLACHFLALLIITVIALSIFKHLAHSPRPADLIGVPNDYSFPSGHVGIALVFWGFIAFIFANQTHNHRHRRIAYTLACFIVFLVAFSRLYLGVHWLTDVIGSVLLGLSCISFIIVLYRRGSQTKSVKILPLLLMVFIVWLALASYFAHKHIPSQLHDFQLAKPAKAMTTK